MTHVRTQNVIDALAGLGFERRTANDSHALYIHPTGASVSVPHRQPRLSGALLKAIARQVTGFGIAPAHLFNEHVFGEEVPTPHPVAPEAIDTGPVPARSALDRDVGRHGAGTPLNSRRRRAATR